MTANILAHCGWEGGPLTVEPEKSFQLASLWTLNIGTYGSTIQDIEAGGIVRSGGGRYALAMRPAGLCGPNGCRSTAFIARATAANTKVWWGGWVRIGYPDNWPNTKVDDQYLLLACTQTAGTAASKHLGIGLILTAGSIWGIQINVVAAAKTYTRTDIGGNFITQGIRAGDTVTFSGFSNAGNNGVKVVDTVTATVITVTSGTGLVNETGDGNEAVTGPVRFKFEAYRLTTTSAIDGAALVPGSSFSADFFADTWYWVQLEVDITTRACKLYVWDGASEVSGTGTDDAGTDYPSYFVPRYFFGGGKGTDASFTVYFDDWSAADTANSGTRPDSTYVEIRHTTTPSTLDFTPTGAGDIKVSDIVNQHETGAGLTGTVEAVTIVFISNSAHTIRARTTGDFQEYPDPGQGYAHASEDWYGKPFNKTPDSSPVAWAAWFNALEAGITAIDTVRVGELHALAFGPNLVRPLAIVGGSLIAVQQAVSRAGTY